MKIHKEIRSLITIAKNWERSSSRLPLVAAFILGMVLTGCAAKVLVFAYEADYQKDTTPTPGNEPGLSEPGNVPGNNPGEYEIKDFVCV